jgi:DNA-directed RNA polymerase
MMMTAARCFDEEVLFASVHDSFWTHACDVPTLNWALREAFIELHQQPLLSHLHAQFQRRYPQIDWSKLPPPVQGDLDVRCVRDATYFFS